MKLDCLVSKLLEVVEKSVRATGKNLTLPVLACLYMSADSKSGNLNIKSTNLDIGLEVELKVNCEQSGSAAVPANIFLNLLSSIKNDSTVKIENLNGNLVVSTKNNTSTIKCFPVDDFPTIPTVNKDVSVPIKVKDFIYGIKSVWYSASVSSIKPELSSVYIYPDDQSLVFVATDSFRLAEKKVHYKKPIEFQSILIPYKNIPDVLKILENYNEEVVLYFDKNQIGMSFDNGNLVSRVVEGSFPDYKQIIPKTNQVEVNLLKNDLIKTIKSAQVFSDPLNQIKFKIEKDSKSIEISTKNNDVGEYKEKLTAQVVGDSLEINFNYKYILDSLQSIEKDSLSLSFSGTGKPMVIKGSGDESFRYVVMPMNR